MITPRMTYSGIRFSDEVERVVRSELWAEGEDMRVAAGRGRGGMVNWRVNERGHAMNGKGVDEVEGGGIVFY